MKPKRQKLTPPQIAAMWGSSVEKVLTFIRRGELKAINLATNLAGRPRYLVDLEDLAAFERSRSVTASNHIERPNHRKHRSPTSRVKNFF